MWLANGEASYKRRLPAGFLDSAFASLATFVVGLTAVNLFDDVNRGVYTVYFTAFLLGTVLPRNLIYTPAEVDAVGYPTNQRLSLVGQSLRIGTGPAVLGAASSVVAYVVTYAYATPSVSVILLVTSAVTTILSPMQDHVRKMLHIAALSWRAASVSIVQFGVVAAAVGVMILVDVPIAWIPFGALGIANLVSLIFGWIVSNASVDARLPAPLVFRELITKGKWLVLHAAAPSITGFAVAAIIAALASPQDLGYAESARVVAQPILVLAAGLTAVLAPRSMRAAMDRDAATAQRTSRIYLSIVGLAGVGYIAVTGWDWALNPMAYIVPSAYVVSGLVTVTVLSNLASAGVFLQVNELLGAHRERALAAIAWAISPVMLLFGFTAGVTGSFARPLGGLSSTSIRYWIQARLLRSVYLEPADRAPESVAWDTAMSEEPD